MKRQKHTQALPELCAAVKRIRESYRDSQPQFAQRVDLAPQTISRFERGVQSPADFQVLMRLARAAQAQGLTEETDLLEHTALAARGAWHRAETRSTGRGLMAMSIFHLQQWRLMHAAGVAALYYPEIAIAIERAAGPALTLVDEAIRLYANEPVSSGLGFANQLALVLETLLERRALERFREEKK